MNDPRTYDIAAPRTIPLPIWWLWTSAMISSQVIVGWNDLNRCVLHFIQKSIQDRTMKKQIPSASSRVTKNYMRDAFSFCKINQGISDIFPFQLHHSCA